jgi:phospholipid-binding lipoprotein MlaA
MSSFLFFRLPSFPIVVAAAGLVTGIGHAQSQPASPPPAAHQAANPTATPSIFDEEPATVAAHPIPDKIEGFNRAIFKFNDGLYRVVLRPVSKAYGTVVPADARHGLGHFFHNLGFPTRFVGNVLEGRFQDAGIETGRFVINTVATLGFGLPADGIKGMQERPSDLGQAFGSWGIGHGTYIVIPLLGPSSVRDGVGLGLSGYFLDPIHYIDQWYYRYGAETLLVVNESPDLLKAYDQLIAASVDPYVALRDAYASQRAHRVTNEIGAPVLQDASAVAPK